jgi:hypothetical protein
VYWNGPDGGRVYVMAEEDYLKSFPVLEESYEPDSKVLDTDNVQQSSMRAPSDVDQGNLLMPGGILSLSANGSTRGTGIVWANLNSSGDANQMVQPGVLRAFDASDVSVELYNNLENEARDSCGDFAKFSYPTIANGKVYLASFSNQLCVYGLQSENP